MRDALPMTRLGHRRKEICKYLGISERTFDRMREAGVFPPPDLRLGTRVLLWLPATVEDWIASQTKRSPKGTGSPSPSKARKQPANV